MDPIITDKIQDNWISRFPLLQNINTSARSILTRSAKVISKPTGAVVFREGQPCDNFMLVVKGIIRVHKKAKDGNEVVLYRIKEGEACGLTMSSLVMGTPCFANAVSETESTLVHVPKHHFRQALQTCEEFNRMVFASLEQNLSHIVSLVGDTLFARMDKRIAQRLLAMQDAHGIVRATHDDIANELGTAREVISRQLKDFEKRGLIKLYRGRIAVLDQLALTAIS